MHFHRLVVFLQKGFPPGVGSGIGESRGFRKIKDIAGVMRKQVLTDRGQDMVIGIPVRIPAPEVMIDPW